MAKPSFIYAAWIRAKAELIAGLEARSYGLSSAQKFFLAEWFRSHMFEVGAEYCTTKEMLAHIDKPEEYAEWERRRICENIAVQLFTAGLYSEEIQEPTREGYGVRRRRLRVLVCGAPSLVGPERRSEP